MPSAMTASVIPDSQWSSQNPEELVKSLLNDPLHKARLENTSLKASEVKSPFHEALLARLHKTMKNKEDVEKREQAARTKLAKQKQQAGAKEDSDADQQQAEMERMKDLGDQLSKQLEGGSTDVAEPETQETVLLLLPQQLPQAPRPSTLAVPDAAQSAALLSSWGAPCASTSASQSTPRSNEAALGEDAAALHALLSGNLVRQLRRLGSCPAATCSGLFETLAYSRTSEVAFAAFRCLVQLLARQPEPYSATPPTPEWTPSADDYVRVLSSYGHTSLRHQPPHPCPPANPPNPVGPPPSATPTNIVLLLRLLSRQCELVAAAQLPNTFPPGRTKQLVPVLMHLVLDASVRRACEADLLWAVEALLLTQDDTAWARVEDEVAAALAALGASHRATVCVLVRLPSGGKSERLRQLGALLLLRRLLNVEAANGKGSGTGRGRGRGAGRGEAAELQGLLGPATAARIGEVLGLCSDRQNGATDPWKVMSVLEAADMVLWAATAVLEPPTAGMAEVERYRQWLKALSTSIITNMSMSRVKRLVSEQEIRYITEGLQAQ